MAKTYDEIQVGDAASFEKTISESDVYLFAGITGDFNPAHVNAAYAEGAKFGGRIAHGMLTASFISNVLGTKLPGEGAVYLSQELSFTAPVFIGDTIKAEAVVTEKLEKGRVRLKTTVTKHDGTVAVEGTALVIAPRGK